MLKDLPDLKDTTYGKGWINGVWNLYETVYNVEIRYLYDERCWYCKLSSNNEVVEGYAVSYSSAFDNARYKIFNHN